MKKRKHFKALKTKYNVMLEEGYQLYLNEMEIGDEKAAATRKVIDKVEVCHCSRFFVSVMICCNKMSDIVVVIDVCN